MNWNTNLFERYIQIENHKINTSAYKIKYTQQQQK